MDIPKPLLRKLLLIRIAKGDGPEVAEAIGWGADPNSRTGRGVPAIVRATRGSLITAAVVKALLEAGADPTATDPAGLTALDHVHRRLLKYEGKPRKPPRRSPSLTPGGEVKIQPEEWAELDRVEREHPEFAEEFIDNYLAARRKAAERVFDTRGELERMLALLTAR